MDTSTRMDIAFSATIRRTSTSSIFEANSISYPISHAGLAAINIWETRNAAFTYLKRDALYVIQTYYGREKILYVRGTTKKQNTLSSK